MKFLTGSETIPTVGVPTKTQVLFNDGCPNRMPKPGAATGADVFLQFLLARSVSIHIPIKDGESLTMFATALLDNVAFRPSYLNTIKVP